MKKILSLVVLVAAVAMVGCAGNCKKNAAPAEAVEAPAEAPAEEAPVAPEK